MKYLKLLTIMAFVMLASCKLDPSDTYYTNVVVPIDERGIPTTALIGNSFNIYAHVTLDNGCWSNIRFYFDTLEDRNFQIFALADYASEGGVCPDNTVTNDTVITLTADEPGDYFFRTWKNIYEFDLDTLRVIEPVKGQ
jgi:hypothetical protein